MWIGATTQSRHLKYYSALKYSILGKSYSCESRQITTVYGFYDEISRKYGNTNVWKYCVDVFDCLSIACVLENKVFCVHAGLSPAIPAIDLIHEIDRRQEIPHEGPFSDLMWSDPEESVDAWSINQRGAGWLFGSKVVEKVRV
jgi:diadenosine tetraphosphatase ApaH/serine/threonine PP2A family protein phosphatase